MAFPIKQNDLEPPFEVVLVENEGEQTEAPVDLTDATGVKFLMREKGDTGVAKVNAAATVVGDPLDGRVRYEWISGDTDTVGEFDAEIQVMFPSSRPATWPNNRFWDIQVFEDLGD
jgi:hypothetical protein